MTALDDLKSELDDVANDFFHIELGPLIVSVERMIESHHKNIFEQELAPSGAYWEELAESTVEAKGHAIILEDLGDLLQSLTFGGMGDAIRERHTTTGAAELLFGTTDPKSEFHQKGTKKMPQREHVGLNDIFIDEFMVPGIADFVIKKLKEKRSVFHRIAGEFDVDEVPEEI